MGAIGFRSSVTGDLASPGGTTTVTLPAGVAATDVVIAIFCSNRVALISPNVVTAPAGWTAIHSSITDNNGIVEGTLHAFWALGNVSSLGFTNSQTVTLSQGWVVAAYTGVDNSTPIDATAAPNSGPSPGGIATSSVTIVTSGAWVLIGGGDTDRNVMSGPAGFTAINNGSPPGNSSANLIYSTTPYAAGPTGTNTIGISVSDPSDVLLGMPFALRPTANVTVVATGQGAAITQGAPVAAIAVAATGQPNVAASGSSTPATAIVSTGQFVMADQGQATAPGDVAVDAVGQSLAAGQGVTSTFTATAAVTGQTVSAAQGVTTVGPGPPLPGAASERQFVVTYVSTNQGW